METIYLVTQTSKGSSPSPVFAFSTMLSAVEYLDSMEMYSYEDERKPVRFSPSKLRMYPFGYAVTYRIESLTIVK